VVLSGPEPQRSILENKIINEIANYNGWVTVVRGLPGESRLIPSSEELNKEMMQAEYMIGRSGYSTIMDIVALQKKSILMPTPGQTEQQYLAEYLLQKNIALAVSQKEFSLVNILEKAKQFSYRTQISSNEKMLQQVVASLYESADYKK